MLESSIVEATLQEHLMRKKIDISNARNLGEPPQHIDLARRLINEGEALVVGFYSFITQQSEQYKVTGDPEQYYMLTLLRDACLYAVPRE